MIEWKKVILTKEKNEMRITRMEKSAKYLLLTVLGIFLVFTVAIAVCSFIDFFNVRSIQIIENSKYSDPRYEDNVAKFKDQNGFKTLFKDVDSFKSLIMLFALRDRSVEQSYVDGDPYIKSAKVNFLPPNQVRVEIFKRTECYKVVFLEREIFLAKDLVVLGENVEITVPELRGLKIMSYEIGKEIQLQSDMKKVLDEIYTNSVYRGKSIVDKISVIDLEDGVFLILNNGVKVELGDHKDIGYKMKCLNDIYFEYLHEYKSGRLDLSNKDKKVYFPG